VLVTLGARARVSLTVGPRPRPRGSGLRVVTWMMFFFKKNTWMMPLLALLTRFILF
jgi:hypothetical protein